MADDLTDDDLRSIRRAAHVLADDDLSDAPMASAGRTILRLCDRIDQLTAENDELHDDVLTVLRVRNAALTQAAAHIHPGPDGADDAIRQSLIEEWVTEGHDRVAGENRQRTQMLIRMLDAERERDEARAEVERLAGGCPHVVVGSEGTSYCQLAEDTVARLTAERDRLREAVADLATRLRDADRSLGDLYPVPSDRVRGKVEGIRLALDYLRPVLAELRKIHEEPSRG